MRLYLVSYELLNRETLGDYDYLLCELRRIRAKRVLASQWILRTAISPSALRDSLQKLMHAEDRLLVAQISPENWAAWNSLVDIGEL